MSSRMGKRSAELISVAATAESSASFLVSGSGAHFWTIVSAAWQSNPTDAAPSPFCMVARTPIRPSSNSASLYMRRVMPLVASTTKPGRSKHTNAAIAPGRPACNPPSAVASWVDDGPGRHWVSAKRLACAVKRARGRAAVGTAAGGWRCRAAKSLCNVHLCKRFSRYPLERSRLGEALEHERYVRRRATEGDEAELGELLDHEVQRHFRVGPTSGAKWLNLRRDLARRCPVVFTPAGARCCLAALGRLGRGWGGVDIMAVSQGKGRTQIKYTLARTKINTL